MENKLKPKEKLFCIYYSRFRSARLAASLAGYSFPKKTAVKILSRQDIRNEIDRLDSLSPVTHQEVVSGYRQLAFGSGTDAFKLLFADEIPGSIELEEMNLLNISEIKRPKNGGIEIKFFDRLKALEKLEEISSLTQTDSALPFYDILERSAAAIKDDDNGT